MARSFHHSLEASNHSPRTIRIYGSAVAQLGAFLQARGMPVDVANISREHVEEYLSALRDGGAAPATVETRYRGLRQFFNWALAEGEITRSPMSGSGARQSRSQRRRSSRRTRSSACWPPAGARTSSRDYAIVRLLLETGMRRSELANLRYSEDEDSDLDLDQRIACVMGKGRRPRVTPSR